MRKIKPPVVRYPGGCFADNYDWRDGIGPRDKRPRRTNFWAAEELPSSPAAHNYDPNQFGTNEFAQFCKLIGSQPYLPPFITIATANPHPSGRSTPPPRYTTNLSSSPSLIRPSPTRARLN